MAGVWLLTLTCASMGPPLFSDGDVRSNIKNIGVIVASMGPPLFSDGDGRQAVECINRKEALQWGRRSSATET